MNIGFFFNPLLKQSILYKKKTDFPAPSTNVLKEKITNDCQLRLHPETHTV